jgi:hypothetical protein
VRAEAVEASGGSGGEDVLVDADHQTRLDQPRDGPGGEFRFADPRYHGLDPQFRRPFGEDEPQDDRLRLPLAIGVMDHPQVDRPDPLDSIDLRDVAAKLSCAYVLSLYEHMFVVLHRFRREK